MVLKANKKNEKFPTAIKLIPMDIPTMGQQTLSEARKVSGISSHDSIVSCIDYWEDEFTLADHQTFMRLVKPGKSDPFYHFPTNAKTMKFLCIRMEFCENGNLKQWLKNRTTVDAWECLQIFLQLARAIEHIHAHSLIHRDVKPANILFFKRNAKISDFGWSAIHNVGEYQHTPRAGAALYQTPEQAFGKYGQSTDYYALGLILYELFHPEAQRNVGEALVNLKYNRTIPGAIARKYPIVAELIIKLISVNSAERPNCSRIVVMVKPLLEALKPKPAKWMPSLSGGCQHYQRNCKVKVNYTRHPVAISNKNSIKFSLLQCPYPECGSVNGFFDCRFCHDEVLKGHKMDRFSISEILCSHCGMQQYSRSACLFCTKSFAKVELICDLTQR